MHEMKESKVASVHVGYDGRVHKRYRGPLAKERYENEVRILRYLEKNDCKFVPHILETHDDELYLVTTNVGRKVDELKPQKLDQLFMELEAYGVEHDDKASRNITYSPQLGRFCIIDFEFSKIISTGEGLPRERVEEAARAINQTLPEPKSD